MEYKAIVYFKDLKDDSHAYHPGEKYPRDGYEPSEERIRELSTDKNRRGMPMIEEVKEKPKKEPKKEEAVKAEAPAEEPKESKPETSKPKRGGKKKNAD